MALVTKINQFPAKQWTFSRYLLRFRREHNRNRGGRSLRLRNRVHSCESACYLPLGRFIATSATLTLNYVLVWSHPRKRVAEIRSLPDDSRSSPPSAHDHRLDLIVVLSNVSANDGPNFWNIVRWFRNFLHPINIIIRNLLFTILTRSCLETKTGNFKFKDTVFKPSL